MKLRTGVHIFAGTMACEKVQPSTQGEINAGPDAEPTAAAIVADRICSRQPWRYRDRVAPCGRGHSPLHLGRCSAPRPPAGPCARWYGPGCRCPRGYAGLERLPPPRAVLRRERHRPHHPHHQPAPASRADGLDRQPRRRRGPVLRHEFSAAGTADPQPLHYRQALGRPVRCRQAARRQRHSESDQLRSADRQPEHRLRLAAA